MSTVKQEFIYPLPDDPRQFPDPRHAPRNGPLAWGGDLDPTRLLNAYSLGIFPWFGVDEPIMWWSPDPRLVLYPQDFKVTKSFRRVLRNSSYKVRFDHDFEGVIRKCAEISRPGQDGTWLHQDMIKAYTQLHQIGYAHSVETYIDDKLAGGVYGISIGRAFFGESMFAEHSNASKIALKALSDVLAAKSYDFIDCQVETAHLMSMGAVLISRKDFLDELAQSIIEPAKIGSWADNQWEYLS